MRVFTSPTLIPAGNAASTKTPTVSFGNIFPRSMNSPGSQTKTCNKWKIFLTTARARLLVTGPRTKYFSNNDLLHFQIEFAICNGRLRKPQKQKTRLSAGSLKVVDKNRYLTAC